MFHLRGVLAIVLSLGAAGTVFGDDPVKPRIQPVNPAAVVPVNPVVVGVNPCGSPCATPCAAPCSSPCAAPAKKRGGLFKRCK